MKIFLSVTVIVLFAFISEAKEFRGVLAYGIGSVSFDDGEELSAEVSQLGFSGTYFFNESGPFLGFSFAQVEIGDYKLDGSYFPYMQDQESDNKSFTVGFRGGQYNEPQFFGAITLERSDVDEGDDESSTSFTVGVEKSTQSRRLEFNAGYTSGDDIDTYGIQIVGVFYPTEQIGFGATASYFIGDGTMDEYEVDVTGWSIGIGIELRLRK